MAGHTPLDTQVLHILHTYTHFTHVHTHDMYYVIRKVSAWLDCCIIMIGNSTSCCQRTMVRSLDSNISTQPWVLISEKRGTFSHWWGPRIGSKHLNHVTSPSSCEKVWLVEFPIIILCNSNTYIHMYVYSQIHTHILHAHTHMYQSLMLGLKTLSLHPS